MTAPRFARVAGLPAEGPLGHAAPRTRADGQRGRACRAWPPRSSRDGANPRERPGSRRRTTWIRKRSHFRDRTSGENPSRRERCERVGEQRRMRSQPEPFANFMDGCSQRSPRGACLGGFRLSRAEFAEACARGARRATRTAFAQRARAARSLARTGRSGRRSRSLLRPVGREKPRAFNSEPGPCPVVQQSRCGARARARGTQRSRLPANSCAAPAPIREMGWPSLRGSDVVTRRAPLSHRR